MKTYRLPNGDVTRSVKVLLREWRKLANPIEKLFGVKLSGFDPDFSFVKNIKTRDGWICQTVQLPRWFVKSLNKNMIKGKNNGNSAVKFC